MVEIKLTVSEDEIITALKLGNNIAAFEKKVASHENTLYKTHNNVFMIKSGEKVICTADAVTLGTWYKIEDKYFWVWTPETHSKICTKTTATGHCVLLKNSAIETGDNMIIMFLVATAAEILNVDVVQYIPCSGDASKTSYFALGLNNIKWQT